ncbi:MAG: HAD-IA family hydrolase [Deltaproteobacteria bacterium]|nr:HAD-IA family hydrolase [Deltaproteobacteria bacterium]
MKAVLFDLDGTLVDSRKDIARAVNATLKKFDLPEEKEEKIFQFVGNGVQNFIKKVLKNEGKEEIYPLFLPSFLEFYYEHIDEHTKPFEGVKQVLGTLNKDENCVLAVVSNKLEKFAHKLLKSLDLLYFFGFVCGCDTFGVKKPDPSIISNVCKSLGMEAKNSMLVGDSENDIIAAKEAGAVSTCVTYGFRSKEVLLQFKPHFVIHNPRQLLTII